MAEPLRLASDGIRLLPQTRDYGATSSMGHIGPISLIGHIQPAAPKALRRRVPFVVRPAASRGTITPTHRNGAHHALFPFNANVSHPPNIPKPPRGVIAPSQRILVTARRYKEPLKRTKPPNMSQNASRGNGSHREITKRTTACTRLYSTPVCQTDSVPSSSNLERNA